MTLTQVETKVLQFLGADATDPPIAQSDLWAMINEAYLEYVARFTAVWSLSNTVTSSAVAGQFVFPATGNGQIIDWETLEVWDGTSLDPDTGIAIYRPLKRRMPGQIAHMRRSIGANGDPELYSAELLSERPDVSPPRSQYQVSVYPIPTTNRTYRARIRTWPTTELTAGANSLQFMDDPQAEQLVLWVAARIAWLLGYPEHLLTKLAGLLPARVAAEFDLQESVQWPISDSRLVGRTGGDQWRMT